MNGSRWRKNRGRSSRAQPQVALGSADERTEPCFVTSLDREVESHAFEGRGKFLRIRAHDFKILQAATRGSVLGGVHRVRAPFDETGHETVTALGKADGRTGVQVALRWVSGA